ncbi:TPA: beta strand repeat-containing protein, partial [Escherichia coli]
MTATAINLTGSSTGAEGIDISGSSTLTATSGNISLNGTAQSQWYGVRIQGRSNITATNGSISLTGNSTNGTGLFLGGTNTLNATNGNINLTSVGGGVIQNASISAGNISINGTATNVDRTGLSVSNSTLNASGCITINGSLDTNTDLSAERSGVALSDGVTLNADSVYIYGEMRQDHDKSNNIYGDGPGGGVSIGNTSINANTTTIIGIVDANSSFVSGVKFNNGLYNYSPVNINLTGNTTIQGTASGKGNGVMITPAGANITVTNGSLNITGTSANRYGIISSAQNGQWASHQVHVQLDNANLSLAGEGYREGIWFTNTSEAPHSPSGLNINGTGNVSISGNSSTRSGVALTLRNNELTGNTTITGNASGNGNGVNISGNITDGVISGSATGNGAGVDISGDSTLTNTTVSGNGTDGAGVSISGNLSNSGNSTVTGNA